jgi:hypothetical protein
MNTPEVMSRKEAASVLMDMAGGGGMGQRMRSVAYRRAQSCEAIL